MQLRIIAEDDFSRRLQQRDIAGGDHGVFTLIVDDAIGQQNAIILRKLYIAARSNGAERFVMDQLVGDHQYGLFADVAFLSVGLPGVWYLGTETGCGGQDMPAKYAEMAACPVPQTKAQDH